VLGIDAADATTLYMFMLLYRQLVHSEFSGQPHASPKVNESDLLKLKKEIRGIGGCSFARERANDGTNILALKYEGTVGDKRRAIKQDIILQIAMRAKEAQDRAKSPPSSLISPTGERPSVGQAPDERMLKLAERWADTNMKPGSPLSNILRSRLRDVVYDTVVGLAFPPRDSTTSKAPIVEPGASVSSNSDVLPSLGTSNGMEPLTDEIRSLAERLSRLALIHLNAFLPLYEQDGFLES
jgi:hypothetical protein